MGLKDQSAKKSKSYTTLNDSSGKPMHKDNKQEPTAEQIQFEIKQTESEIKHLEDKIAMIESMVAFLKTETQPMLAQATQTCRHKKKEI